MRLDFLAIPMLSLFPAAAAAQASVTYFGQGSVYYRPEIVVSGVPRLGQNLDISVRYTPPSGGCPTVLTWYDVLLVTGLSNRRWGGLQLPFQLGADCPLLVSGEVILGQRVLSNTACPPMDATNRLPYSFRLKVPIQTNLIGTKVYQQIVLVSRALGRTPTCLGTNGAEVTIGR